ncbi:MAG TPA: phage tail sheath C-terminal domain-containing protein [Mycobacteriales bacterium]|nr:phage tail sheath C-terminal domain-containing protein [Mycobacteriales bacterium]
MPEFLSPGVFIEEIDAGPRPIAGVSTSTAGMVGVTVRGPVDGKPQLVTNFLEFQRTFGGFLPVPDANIANQWANNPLEGGQWWRFALSVQGFFANGGQRLFVKRVASKDATASTGVLGGGVVSEITADASAGATELALRHLIGFTGNGSTVAIVRGSDGVVLATTTISAYSSTGPTVRLADPLAAAVRTARGDYVRVGPAVASPVTDAAATFRFAAASPGGWGDKVAVRVRQSAAASLPLLPDPGEALVVTQLAADAAANSDTLVLNPVDGLDEDTATPLLLSAGRFQLRVTAVGPLDADGRLPVTLAAGSAHPQWSAGFAVRKIRPASTGNPNQLRVGGASRLYPGAVVQIDDGTTITAGIVQAVTDDLVTLAGQAPANLFETARLTLVEVEVDTRFTDEAGDLVEETLANLRLSGGVDDTQSVVGGLATRSQLVTAKQGDGFSTDLTQWPTAPGGSWLQLSGGDDDFGALTTADFVGADGGSGHRTGIVALEDIDEVSIAAVPGVWAGTVTSSLINHCEQLKDRFALIDPQHDLSIEGILEFREVYDTRYAALYHPWLMVPDLASGLDVEVAPSGHIAGVYARTDVERGVHKAPANAVVRGIRARDGFAQDITKRQQDLLNPKGINALRFFPGFGHRVWGARTLSSDSSWKYVNVRRLFLFVEESIDEGTQWAVFEPNGEALWALIRQTVTDFLTTTWRNGALAGTTPDEAFFVACDRSTMTEDDIANGRLICVIGIAPVFPAEFVIFRIQQKTREAQLT